MYINSMYSNDISMKGNQPPKNWKRFVTGVKQKFIDIIPDATYKSGNDISNRRGKINDIISRPCENRIIMGATALLTQPAIDYYNHRVDNETRVVSRNRTIAKILAGTAVGVCVRGPVYKFVEKMTNPEGKAKFSKALLPRGVIFKSIEHLKNYRSVLAMIFSLAVMSITNFAVDAPLTLILTDMFNKNVVKKEVKNERK